MRSASASWVAAASSVKETTKLPGYAGSLAKVAASNRRDSRRSTPAARNAWRCFWSTGAQAARSSSQMERLLRRHEFMTRPSLRFRIERIQIRGQQPSVRGDAEQQNPAISGRGGYRSAGWPRRWGQFVESCSPLGGLEVVPLPGLGFVPHDIAID